MFHSFEHQSGKMLVAAIKKNCAEDVTKATEFARKEFVKPRTRGVSNTAEFEDSIIGLLSYLTLNEYEVGDGPLFKITALEWCKRCKADQASEALNNELAKLLRVAASEGIAIPSNVPLPVKTSSLVGEVSSDRATIAKERLKAFQQARK